MTRSISAERVLARIGRVLDARWAADPRPEGPTPDQIRARRRAGKVLLLCVAAVFAAVSLYLAVLSLSGPEREALVGASGVLVLTATALATISAHRLARDSRAQELRRGVALAYADLEYARHAVDLLGQSLTTYAGLPHTVSEAERFGGPLRVLFDQGKDALRRLPTYVVFLPEDANSALHEAHDVLESHLTLQYLALAAIERSARGSHDVGGVIPPSAPAVEFQKTLKEVARADLRSRTWVDATGLECRQGVLAAVRGTMGVLRRISQP